MFETAAYNLLVIVSIIIYIIFILLNIAILSIIALFIYTFVKQLIEAIKEAKNKKRGE